MTARLHEPPAKTSELLDRTPPHNADAERAVIGSMLLDRAVIDDVALLVRAEDFHLDAHRKLFSHLKAMHDGGGRIDATLLLSRIEKSGELAAVGGMAYIAEVVNFVPVASHAAWYAAIVRDESTWRRLIAAGVGMVQAGYGRDGEPGEALQVAEREVFRILEDRTSGDVRDIGDVLGDVLQTLERGEAVRGLDCGYPDINAVMGGLRPGELIILAGRTSMGKTALALNIAERVSMDGGHGVFFASLEMNRAELALRIACSRARTNLHQCRNGFLKSYEKDRLAEAIGRMRKTPLFIDDAPLRRVSDIASVARRLKRTKDIKLVIVDYLQLVTATDRKEPREQQVAEISRRLKGLARELNVPVLCLAQLNRQADSAKNARPKLSHLRESGAIEQDADVVAFVHRQAYYEETESRRDEMRNDADVLIEKNRNGPPGDVKLRWLPEYTRFESMAKERNDGSSVQATAWGEDEPTDDD